MRINEAFIRFISSKAGCDVTTPSGAAFLRDDIESVTGERLSLNTVKRLVGVLPYEGNPRDVTLDILGRYAGCGSWENLISVVDGSISGFELDDRVIDMTALSVGSEAEIEWAPDRVVRIKHLGEGLYNVVASINSKLMSGDELDLTQVGEGFPLISKCVRRGGRNLGPYTAASRLGVKSIKIVS